MKILFSILAAIVLTACGSEPVAPPSIEPIVPESRHYDFSGHWEMDYGRSDNVDDQVRRLYREWRQAVERQQRGDQYRASAGVPPDQRSFRAMVDVARLADNITNSQVLEIEQSPSDIEIQREDNFALSCVFNDGEPEVVVAELGAEVCGWDAHQLVFHIRLPDGLDIRHRLTMSEDAERLHVATQVDSKKSKPFTINRFYYRFDPLPEDYSCEYTLSRGNVCQSESSR